VALSQTIQQRCTGAWLTIDELADFVEAAREAGLSNDVDLVVTTRPTLHGHVLRSISTRRRRSTTEG
jgi:hypothetical protein